MGSPGAPCLPMERTWGCQVENCHDNTGPLPSHERHRARSPPHFPSLLVLGHWGGGSRSAGGAGPGPRWSWPCGPRQSLDTSLGLLCGHLHPLGQLPPWHVPHPFHDPQHPWGHVSGTLRKWEHSGSFFHFPHPLNPNFTEWLPTHSPVPSLVPRPHQGPGLRLRAGGASGAALATHYLVPEESRSGLGRKVCPFTPVPEGGTRWSREDIYWVWGHCPLVWCVG